MWVASLLVLLGRSPGGQRTSDGDGSQVGGDGYLQRDHDGAHGCAGHGTGGEGGRAQVWTTSKVVVSVAVESPPTQTSNTEGSRTQSRSVVLQ